MKLNDKAQAIADEMIEDGRGYLGQWLDEDKDFTVVQAAQFIEYVRQGLLEYLLGTVRESNNN